MKIQIISNVINGKLNRNRNLLIDAIQSFEGKEISITIEKAKKQRSNCQNAYYWGVVIKIVKSCLKSSGNILSDNDTHDLLRLKFLKATINVNETTGECIERIKSTTELSTSEFMEYIAEIQKFAAEYFNTIIPDPNENLILDL
jgi:midasin (ATPase involved in ribosome maturation)